VTRPAALAGVLALGVTLTGCVHARAVAVPSPPTISGWTLSWSDEFEGPAGTRVDSTRWTFDVGGGGWGNQELQSYTDRPRNARLDGNGALIIDILRESHVGPDGIPRDYTSARLKTQGLFSQAYGRFEARLKLPWGRGIWPAFWMLGTDIPSAGWPACGEIDIMENVGHEPGVVHSTVHGPGYSAAGGLGGSVTLPAGGRFADDFHVFAVEWESEVLRFSVDGQIHQSLTPAALPAGRRWVFDHPFFLLLNVAVGGHWPGPPDASTVFPQQMLVDYVRVYRR
jgi:beta-glucanase (GH16 family)